ncbi:hypothetical protein UFOVP53_145 [uncultured Caudovirales phage]|uniref:Uncharacterized protein n=1 Tax=uncultured Caudovirales phage TaxID=2100421 RepID=A0A6J5KWM2_9CAUD|nr:hypothetical protein UFOVP53_145 [uncultured Caudovirales phage]
MNSLKYRMAFLKFKGTLSRLDKKFRNGTRSDKLSKFIIQWGIR